MVPAPRLPELQGCPGGIWGVPQELHWMIPVGPFQLGIFLDPVIEAPSSSCALSSPTSPFSPAPFAPKFPSYSCSTPVPNPRFTPARDSPISWHSSLPIFTAGLQLLPFRHSDWQPLLTHPAGCHPRSDDPSTEPTAVPPAHLAVSKESREPHPSAPSPELSPNW